MNTEAILTLISELYSTLGASQQRLAAAEQRIAELEAEERAAPGEGDRGVP